MDRRNGFSPAQLEELAEIIGSMALSEEQMDAIATAAAAKAVEQMTAEAYRMVGKTVVDKALWVIGVVVVGLTILAAKNGWLK